MDIEILKEFKKSLISFIDELIATFPEESDFVVVRIFFNDQFPIKDVVNIFNQKINQSDQLLKKMIKDRNEAFFLEHNIFDVLGKSKVNHFKRLWCSEQLDDQDKEIIWKWIESFVYLGDKYMKSLSQL